MSISEEGGDDPLFTVEWSEKERRAAARRAGVSVVNLLQFASFLVLMFVAAMMGLQGLKTYYSMAVPIRAILVTFIFLSLLLFFHTLIRFTRRFIPSKAVFYPSGVEVVGGGRRLFLPRKNLRVSLLGDVASIYYRRSLIPMPLEGDVEEYLKGIQKDAVKARPREVGRAILLSAIPSLLLTVAILYLLALVTVTGRLSFSLKTFRYTAEMFLPFYPVVFLPIASALTIYYARRMKGTPNVKIDLVASKKVIASFLAILFGSATLLTVMADPFYGLYSLRYEEWSGIESVADTGSPVPFTHTSQENITLDHSVSIVGDVTIQDCRILVNSSTPITMVVERGVRAVFHNVTFVGSGQRVFSLVGRGTLELYNTSFRNLSTPPRRTTVSGVIETYSTLKAVDVNITTDRGTLIYAHTASLTLENISATTADYALLAVSSTVRIFNSKIQGSIASYAGSDVEIEEGWVYSYAYCHGRSVIRFKGLEDGSFVSKYVSFHSRIDISCRNCTVNTLSLTYFDYLRYFIYPVSWFSGLIPAVSLMNLQDKRDP